jgi:oxygen-independent coproporphyrinogen-3 oxidase
VAEIIAATRSLWAADEALEITLEANPTDAEMRRFAALAEAGVNRLSLGVQSLDDDALAFLGRNHSAREGVRATQIARALFPNLSLDLIYARPDQASFAWTVELETAVALGADHVSPYQLTIEPGTAFAKAVGRGDWGPPDQDLAAALYQTTQDTLTGMGFLAYEVSNHARAEAYCSRHNLVYWRGEDYVGVGPGAHGRLLLGGARTATTAHAKVRDYTKRVEEAGLGWESREPLTPVQAAQERVLMGLRTIEGVGLMELEPLGFEALLPKVKALVEGGLVEVARERLYATAAGRLVLDRITTELAAA